jgi:hypothetical protein
VVGDAPADSGRSDPPTTVVKARATRSSPRAATNALVAIPAVRSVIRYPQAGLAVVPQQSTVDVIQYSYVYYL